LFSLLQQSHHDFFKRFVVVGEDRQSQFATNDGIGCLDRIRVTDDAHFTCRTDTGTTDYEEFVRSDLSGRAEVMAWQTDHRSNSPYPLRHNAANVHVVEDRGDEATFASYIFVTQIVDGVAPLSTAIVTGAVRAEVEGLRIAELNVVLDTMTSVVFSQR